MKNNKLGYIICESGIKLEQPKIVTSNENRVIAEGIMQTADEKNRNGRIYEENELFPEITCARTKELIKAGYMRGEAGHPISKDLARQQNIDPSNVCVRYLEFWTKGKDVWARFKGTNNELGEAFDMDLREGCLPAFSLRALGSLENTAKGAVVRNLKFITYDHVIYPSHPNAYTSRLVSESSNLITTDDKNKYSSLPDNMKYEYNTIEPIMNQDIINYIKEQSLGFKAIKESFDVFYDTIELLEGGRSVQMKDKIGNIIILPIENYIYSEIMEYASNLR